ncbi:MAG TPA: preprotein translocase subunit SecE [Thermoanaerobaculia bacterium]|nr:preprotein translocase subunit SecE [Thermoanaerobaculia bacterium]
MTPEKIGWIVTAVVVAGLAGLAWWVYKVGHYAKGLTFIGEVRSEMKKVTFPPRDEVVATTIVVIVASVIFAVYLWVADFLILRGYEGLFKALGS